MMPTKSSLFFSLALLLALGWIPGCGSSDDNLGITNVAPEGSVGGVVLDLATGQPMAGVNVTLVAGGKAFPSGEGSSAITTDANGRFFIDKVPAGQLIVDLAPPATHLPARFTATIDDAAGDFPRSNGIVSVGPVALVPVVAEAKAFRIRVIHPDGSPAANVEAVARASFSWAMMDANGRPSARGLTTVGAKSDSVGVVIFKGLPDFGKLAALRQNGFSDALSVTIPAVDTNNDGAYDFPGTTRQFSVNALGTTYVPSIVLGTNPGSLKIVATTIPGLGGKKGNRVVNAGSPIFVNFNMPIDQNLVDVALFDEEGIPVTNSITKSVDGTLLTLNFSKLTAGQEYNLNLHIVAMVSGFFVDGTFATPFFVAPDPKATVTAQLQMDATNPQKVYVTFSEPIGTGVAGQSLAVLFYNFDLGATGATGDEPGELGASTTNLQLINREKDPPGAVGRSGFTRDWELSLPLISGNPVPPNTVIKMVFSHSGSVVTRANGQVVPTITSAVP